MPIEALVDSDDNGWTLVLAEPLITQLRFDSRFSMVLDGGGLDRPDARTTSVRAPESPRLYVVEGTDTEPVPNKGGSMSQAAYDDNGPRSGWVGWIAFAAVMMIIAGSLNLLHGLIAVVNDEWVVFSNRGNLYLDLTAWGWIHIILGAALLVSGIALFSGNVLARTIGVLFAASSLIANFLWLPAYPIWSIIVITIDLLVIWALTAHGRDAQD